MLHHMARPIELFDRFGPRRTTPAELGRPALPVRSRRDGSAVAIRVAGAADAAAVAALAAMNDVPAPEGPALVAEGDGEAWAAVGIEDPRVVADPFKPAAAVVEQLEARAEPVRAELGARRRRPQLRLRLRAV